MATSISKSSIFIAFLWLLLLLSSINGQNDQCKFPSGTWKGPCVNNDKCATQCREKESALGGECSIFACWCTYNCAGFCYSPSGTWHGLCVSKPLCSKQCRERDHKFRGSCKDNKCVCAYYC